MLETHAILVQSTAKSSSVIKIVPPLVIGESEADLIADALLETLADLRRGRGAAIRGLIDMLSRAPDVVLRETFR
jgi:hypothetical protein